jgi:hypothetical protein
MKDLSSVTRHTHALMRERECVCVEKVTGVSKIWGLGAAKKEKIQPSRAATSANVIPERTHRAKKIEERH